MAGAQSSAALDAVAQGVGPTVEGIPAASTTSSRSVDASERWFSLWERDRALHLLRSCGSNAETVAVWHTTNELDISVRTLQQLRAAGRNEEAQEAEKILCSWLGSTDVGAMFDFPERQTILSGGIGADHLLQLSLLLYGSRAPDSAWAIIKLYEGMLNDENVSAAREALMTLPPAAGYDHCTPTDLPHMPALPEEERLEYERRKEALRPWPRIIKKLSRKVVSLPLVDAHTHIQDTKPLPLAGTRALTAAVVLSTSARDWNAVLDLCSSASSALDTHCRLLPALGVHPWYLNAEADGDGEAFSLASWPATLAALRERLVALGPSVSVGEIGLDKAPRAVAKNPWETQLEVFRSQLRLAAELGRPVSLHCVRCYDDMSKELETLAHTTTAADGAPTSIPAILFHSFGGAPHVIQRLSELFPQPSHHPWAFAPCCGGREGGAKGSKKGKLAAPSAAPSASASAGAGSDAAPVMTTAGTRVLISFQGSIVAPVVEAFSDAFSLPFSSSSSPSAPDSSAAAAATGAGEPGAGALAMTFKGGASKQTMAVLASLPYHQICFETDAPYQPFSADYAHPSYRSEWRDKVAALVTGLPSHSYGDEAVVSPSMHPDSSTIASKNDVCCGPADDAAAAATELKTPPQTPARVVDVIIAAATWRVLKNCRPKTKPSHAAEPPWWPEPSAVAQEAVLLARASASNVLECFTAPYGALTHYPPPSFSETAPAPEPAPAPEALSPWPVT